MNSKNHNKTYLIGAMLLLMTVTVSVHAQDAKPKKEIRITILQDGKVKHDTSFEVKRDIPKDELNAMVESLQKKPEKNKNFLPRWRHKEEAFSFPFNEMPNLGSLDSMFKNNPNGFGFSMKFDNDSVFEKYFRGFGSDSVFTYKWKYEWNNGKNPNQKGINEIELLDPDDMDIIEIINDEDIIVPDQEEIIIEGVIPKDADNNETRTIKL